MFKFFVGKFNYSLPIFFLSLFVLVIICCLDISIHLFFCKSLHNSIFIQSLTWSLQTYNIHDFFEIVYSLRFPSIMKSSWRTLLLEIFSFALILSHDVVEWVIYKLFLDSIIIFITGVLFNRLRVLDQFFLNKLWQLLYREYSLISQGYFQT